MITKSSDNLNVINWPTPRVLAFSPTRLFPTETTQRFPKETAYQINHADSHSSEFDYFNLGDHVGDCAINVANNRNTLLSLLTNDTKIQWFEQVHGNSVAYIDKVSDTAIVADAAITREKNIALSIMTADCLPILLADKNGNEIAAIHAGWRPLAKNIIKKTINQMQTPTDELIAWLGPCIGRQSFEVGAEVRQEFIELSDEFSVAFTAIKSTIEYSKQAPKFIADLAKIALLQLHDLGIENITMSDECTYTQSDKYYSFRRDGKTGRMASVIALV